MPYNTVEATVIRENQSRLEETILHLAHSITQRTRAERLDDNSFKVGRELLQEAKRNGRI